MDLKKFPGPFTGVEAKAIITGGNGSLYVISIKSPADVEGYDPPWEFITNDGPFLRGFILDSDIISNITVWKD